MQMKKLKTSPTGISSFGYRLYNELPTLILISVVILAVGKSTDELWTGILLLLALAVLFFIAAILYKKKRK